MRAKRQRRQQMRHEEHATHRDVNASTIRVATSAMLVGESINKAEVVDCFPLCWQGFDGSTQSDAENRLELG